MSHCCGRGEVINCRVAYEPPVSIILHPRQRNICGCLDVGHVQPHSHVFQSCPLASSSTCARIQSEPGRSMSSTRPSMDRRTRCGWCLCALASQLLCTPSTTHDMPFTKSISLLMFLVKVSLMPRWIGDLNRVVVSHAHTLKVLCIALGVSRDDSDRLLPCEQLLNDHLIDPSCIGPGDGDEGCVRILMEDPADLVSSGNLLHLMCQPMCSAWSFMAGENSLASCFLSGLCGPQELQLPSSTCRTCTGPHGVQMSASTPTDHRRAV